MLKWFCSSAVLASLAIASGCASGPSVSPVAQTVAAPAAALPVNAQGKLARLPIGTCINLGNHLEPPTEGAWGRKLEDADFPLIAKAGFDTVRLPVRWSAHSDTKAPYTIEPAFLKRVVHLVGQARKAGLKIIVNDHNFDALMEKPAEHRERLAGIWKQVAEALKDHPDAQVWFEIANEPHKNLDNTNLIETLSPALRAIRSTNPTRPVIIGGEKWSGIDSLKTLSLPDDPNVIATFHYYEPFDFTHQGAGWVGMDLPKGRTYGTQADQARLTGDVQKIRDYIARTGQTPFMGENGAYTSAPLPERIKYHTAITQAFADLDLGNCTWAFTNTFPVYDSTKKAWIPGMRKALGLAE